MFPAREKRKMSGTVSSREKNWTQLKQDVEGLPREVGATMGLWRTRALALNKDSEKFP